MVAEEITRDNDVKIIEAEWWRIAWDKIKRVLTSKYEELGPGGEDETAIMLYLCPQYVKKELIKDGEFRDEPYSVYPLKEEDYIEIMGKPSCATKEKGKSIMEKTTIKIIEIIKKEF